MLPYSVGLLGCVTISSSSPVSVTLRVLTRTVKWCLVACPSGWVSLMYPDHETEVTVWGEKDHRAEASSHHLTAGGA